MARPWVTRAWPGASDLQCSRARTTWEESQWGGHPGARCQHRARAGAGNGARRGGAEKTETSGSNLISDGHVILSKSTTCWVKTYQQAIGDKNPCICKMYNVYIAEPCVTSEDEAPVIMSFARSLAWYDGTGGGGLLQRGNVMSIVPPACPCSRHWSLSPPSSNHSISDTSNRCRATGARKPLTF